MKRKQVCFAAISAFEGVHPCAHLCPGSSVSLHPGRSRYSLSGEKISSLPLNFRATNALSPINTAILTPTVNEDSGGNLTFAGQVPTATSFSPDGISIQQTRYGGPTKDLFPSVEASDEFRVNTAGDGAEYAQPTDLTVTTKGGTNKFHGTAYWFAQRKGWNDGQMFMSSASPLVDRLIGGWSMTAINLYHSGDFHTPYFPSGSYDPSGTAPHNRSVSKIRPDNAAGVSTSPTNTQRAAGLHFNSLAFEFPGGTPGGPAPSAPIGRFGNAGVGTLVGPSTETFPTSLGKNLPISERFVLRYEVQVSNIFNFVNANNPALNITSPGSFGLYTSSQSTAQGGPRTIQMSLRLSY